MLKEARKLYDNGPFGLEEGEMCTLAGWMTNWAKALRAQNALDRQEREERLREHRALVARLEAIQGAKNRWRSAVGDRSQIDKFLLRDLLEAIGEQ